jgi:hypothetical protein
VLLKGEDVNGFKMRGGRPVSLEAEAAGVLCCLGMEPAWNRCSPSEVSEVGAIFSRDKVKW